MATPPCLDGLTVLDLSSVGPASRCSRILADYGATVIKISPPPRRESVQIRPPWWAYSGHRGMKHARIDLKSPEGRDAFLRLAAIADVLIESLRPGVAARLGIGYEDVKRLNAGIVYCSTSGYGQDGPASTWAGHDLNYLAVAGFLDGTGRRSDDGPALPGATVADSAGGGMQAAIAILAALLRRTVTSEGAYLDVSVADGVLYLMALHVDRYLATGEAAGPGCDILTGRYACYDVYRARDGRWLAVAAIEPAFYANLCRALGLEEWIAHQTDDSRQDEIREAFRRAFARRDRDAWVADLAPRDTCVSGVYSIEELVRDAQFSRRGAFVEAEHPEHGPLRQVGPVLAGSERTPTALALPDPSSTDTDAVLREAGLTEVELDRMRESGVVA